MNANPLVSVVIPVYNGANYLEEAVQSVFSQTYPNIEVILVDDGSRDNTWNLIHSFGKRVRGFQKENGGVASALNHGIQHANGEYIAWLSHDDQFLPEKVERQVGFLNDHPEYGACYTDFEIIDMQGRHLSIYKAPWHPAWELPRRFIQDMHINGSTVLFRKVCLEKAGPFNTHLAHTQDLEMWLRFSQCCELGHLPAVLLKSRSHPEQGSLNFEVQIEEEQKLLLDLYQQFGPERYFPELKQISPTENITALGHEKLGDEVRKYRHWYRFALQQYLLSAQLRPALRTRWKIIACRLAMFAFGDERESLMGTKRARIVLSQGNPLRAREIAAAMVRKHPLRLDAWSVWFLSFIPKQSFEVLREIKRAIQ